MVAPPAGFERSTVGHAALETAVVIPHEGQGMSYMSIHEREELGPMGAMSFSLGFIHALGET